MDDPRTEQEPGREEERPSPTDAAPEAPADDPMDHRFAADEEVADGEAAGADEARTAGMGS